MSTGFDQAMSFADSSYEALTTYKFTYHMKALYYILSPMNKNTTITTVSAALMTISCYCFTEHQCNS